MHHLRVRKVKTDNVADVIDDDMENDTCTEQRQPDETQSTEKITTEVAQGLREAEPTGRTTRGENLTSPQMQRRHSHGERARNRCHSKNRNNCETQK